MLIRWSPWLASCANPLAVGSMEAWYDEYGNIAPILPELTMSCIVYVLIHPPTLDGMQAACTSSLFGDPPH